MSFFSENFILFFITLILLYYTAGKVFQKLQWILLLIGSFYFYKSGNALTYIIITILTTWFISLKIYESQNHKKLLLFSCLLINFGILAYLKYRGLISFSSNNENIIIPLGISYYTFISAGYCIDVFKGAVSPEKNLFKYALFTSYFPQIISGPISRYNDLAPQFEKAHQFNYQNFCNGLERVILGCFKKFVIANNLALVVDSVYKSPESYTGSILFFIAILYTIQLYMDFSGYIDIALGISKCFRINLNENFKTPLFSKSIKDFWRRWHITLGTWFRDYVYIPLGGNRKGKFIQSINLFIVFFLIGLWHGAMWSFIFFGLFHSFFIITDVWFDKYYEKIKNFLKIKPDLKIWKIFQIFRTFIVVCFGFIFFRADSIDTAFVICSKIFSDFSVSSFVTAFTQYWNANLTYCILLLTGLLTILMIELIENKQKFSEWLDLKPVYIKWPVIYFLIVFTLMEFYNQNSVVTDFIYHHF